MNQICCIKVNKETSSLVQELMFSYGYKWSDGSKQVENTTHPYLYIYDDMDICYGLYKDNGDKEVSFVELLDYFKTGYFQYKIEDYVVRIEKENITFNKDGKSFSIPKNVLSQTVEKIKE